MASATRSGRGECGMKRILEGGYSKTGRTSRSIRKSWARGSRRTIASIRSGSSSRYDISPDTAATPSTARCQRSWLSTSATATLSCPSLALRLWTTERLAFRLCEAWINNSMRYGAPYTGAPSALPDSPSDELDHEGLDDIALVNVVVTLEADTALEALRHFLDVVLEATKAADLARVDDLALAHQPRL